jgi:hypothetical protein
VYEFYFEKSVRLVFSLCLLLKCLLCYRYWVFRSWGRIGTTIGGNKLEDMDSLQEAVRHFENLYEEKTGNMWSNRKKFQKVPGRFFPLELDYTPVRSHCKCVCCNSDSEKNNMNP